MMQSGGSLDSTVVTATDNSAEVFAAFELQSKEFQNVQLDFENYMERLKEDIDFKAEKFEHIDYYDALLRDGISKEIAVATAEVHDLDSRRKPLININPLFAKTSDLPPQPSIEDITFEHVSLNLPSIAKNTLKELESETEFMHHGSNVIGSSDFFKTKSENEINTDVAVTDNSDIEFLDNADEEELDINLGSGDEV